MLPAFGFAESNNGAAVETLSGILSSQGLCGLVTDAIPFPSNECLKDSIGDLFEVFDRIYAESHSRHRAQLLWVFRDSQQKGQIRIAAEGQLEVGLVLG